MRRGEMVRGGVGRRLGSLEGAMYVGEVTGWPPRGGSPCIRGQTCRPAVALPAKNVHGHIPYEPFRYNGSVRWRRLLVGGDVQLYGRTAPAGTTVWRWMATACGSKAWTSGQRRAGPVLVCTFVVHTAVDA